MIGPKQYGAMSGQERLAWGIAEVQQRKADLKLVQSPTGLEVVQEKARARRRRIGATMAQATRMVTEANRHLRRMEPAS